ncbi:UNVERIFIED_CONTAM: hypothetical protein FKN15_066345 [Acipenser sinensis]
MVTTATPHRVTTGSEIHLILRGMEKSLPLSSPSRRPISTDLLRQGCFNPFDDIVMETLCLTSARCFMESALAPSSRSAYSTAWSSVTTFYTQNRISHSIFSTCWPLSRICLSLNLAPSSSETTYQASYISSAFSPFRIVHRRPRPFHIIELNYKGGKKKRKVHLDQVYQAGSHPQPEGRKRDPPSEEPVPVPHCTPCQFSGVPHCTPSVVPKKSYKDRKKEECQAWAEIKCHLQRVAIEQQGRVHQGCTVTMCACEPESASLLRFGFWPLSPKSPVIAVSTQLLDWLHYLTLEAQVSVQNFVDTLMSKEGLFFSQKNGELFVSLDANFGLVHKQNSGHSCEAPQLAPAVFLSQADVDAFVNGYDDTSKKGHGKRNNTRVLEAIQFAIPVFHSYGHKEDCQVCLNPRRLKGFGLVDGEQLERLWSYLRLFAKTTKEMTPSHRLDMLAMAVALYSHKKQLGMDKYLVDKLNRAVLVFQSSGEKVDALLEEFHHKHDIKETCVRKLRTYYFLRRLKGFGLVDGEQLERLWSYLRLFAKTTKEMTPSHRLDMLAMAVALYSHKKQLGMDKYLVDKLNRAVLVFQSSGEKVDALLEEFHHKHDIKETYVRKLRTYYFLRLNEDLCAMEVKLKISQRWQPGHIEYQTALLNQEEAKKLEMLHKIRLLAVERDFLVGVRSKYSEGQSVANRVTVALRRVSSALTKKVAVFNSLGFSSTEGDLPATISLVDAKDTSSDLFLNFEEKRWIDNYKKKVKRREHPSEHRVKLAKRSKRGIDVFYSENLSKQEGNTNKEKLQALHRTWRSSTAEEQERYSEKARKMPPPQQPADHSPDQKKILYKDALKNIAKQYSATSDIQKKFKEPENMTKSTAEAGIENSLTNKQNKVDASQLLESLMKDDDSASEAKQGLPEGFYKVEKLLKKRKKNGKIQYLVKWEGYEKASWEPEQNMSIFPS